ncbi:MAG: hypothetical protein HW400_703 [Candidatus Levybacteria bacterium]|nr:hypothetical protein [Candidatus Levybacteria bacterium]
MQAQRINITIPNTILKILQESVPSGKRSEFIAEAVLGRLDTTKNIGQQFRKSLMRNKELYNQAKKDWEATELETWPK